MQGGHALGNNFVSGAATLSDGSVVLVGTTDGDFAGVGSNQGGDDFAIIKLTAAGETEWTWQVTRPDDLRNTRAATNTFILATYGVRVVRSSTKSATMVMMATHLD